MAFSTVVSATSQNQFMRDRSVNATGSFPSRVPTTTAPTTIVPQTVTSQDIFDNVTNGQTAINARIVPFGVGSATQTFSIRVIGWTDAVPAAGSAGTTLWIPTILCEYLCTLCTAVGVAGSAVLDTENFVDTLSLVANRGTDGQDTTKFSTGNNLISNFIVDLKGSKKIEILYSVGTNTSCNSLVQWI